LKDSDPKRGQLEAAAKTLFWKHGIRRVSVEEICREAGISRMTFYKHFEDKDAVIRAILQTLENEGLEQYRNIMKSDSSFPEKVKALVRMKTEQTEMTTHEFFHDLHRHASPDIAGIMERIHRNGLRLMEKDLMQAQKDGHFRAGIHPKFFMYLMDKMIEMAHDEALIKMYPAPQDMIMELTNFYFYGILPPEGREKTSKPERS
jgi:AcrR family transcriptional regulator